MTGRNERHFCNSFYVCPKVKSWEKEGLCDLIFFIFSCFIHCFVSYWYLYCVWRTEVSCSCTHCSWGKQAFLVTFILSLRVVLSRSCLIILDNAVTCSQREVVHLSGLMGQTASVSFQGQSYTWCCRWISGNQGIFIYPSTELLIASAKTHRWYLSVKSPQSSQILLPPDIFRYEKIPRSSSQCECGGQDQNPL